MLKQNDGVNEVRVLPVRETVRVSGDVNHSLRFMLDSFFRTLPRLPSKRCVDLMYIAAGVYAVDRLIRRTTRARPEPGSRSCALSIAVHDLQFWDEPYIRERIEQILTFLTDEDWSVRFEAGCAWDGENGHQHPLRLSQPYQPSRVALYSGGLDSAAGLANQLIAGVRQYVLVTIGHQSWLRKKARQQIEILERSLGAPRLLHSAVLTGLKGRPGVSLSEQEKAQRTRSFLFASCAVAAASAFEVEQIDVFENGVGSINLPLMTGSLFGGLSTRGAHPTFLRYMSELGSLATERRISFVLPFFAMTKSRMLKPLREHGLELWAQSSRSCVHSSWRIKGKSHCGTCPACIERRQAFAAAGIREANYYSTDIFHQSPRPGGDADYLRLYIDDAQAWLRGDARPRRRLYNHLRLTDVPDNEDGKIASLHIQHCLEVASVFRH